MNPSSVATNTTVVAGETESIILRNYYKEIDFFVSPEGILKLISVVTGLAVSAFLVFGNACIWSPWLIGSSTGVALAAASISAALYVGVLTSIPAHAPHVYFYTDLVLSTALGITLLVFAILNMTFCDMASVIDYFHGAIGTSARIVNEEHIVVPIEFETTTCLIWPRRLFFFSKVPLALVNAGLVAGSAIVTYASVMRRLDAGRDMTPPQTTPLEHDV